MKNYTFLLKEKSFNIPASRDFLNRVSQNMASQLLRSDNYIVKSNVDEKNFQEFLNYLTTEDYQLELNSDNCQDYLLLNKEFDNIISHILSKPENDLLNKESILNILISNKNEDKSQYEEDVARDLDFYLKNYREKMSKIPINSLHNIFNHKNCNLKDHERASQFIITNVNQNADDEKKKSFCILLRNLDATKMNEKSVNDLVKNQDTYFGFLPRSNDSFICSVNKKIEDMKNQIDDKFDQLFSFILNQQQQNFEKITQKFEEKLSSIENRYQFLSSKIEESKQLIIENQNNIQQISQKIENINNGEIKNDLQLIKEKVDSIKNNFIPISQKIENINDDGIKNDLQLIKEKVDSIENSFIPISQKIDLIKDHAFYHIFNFEFKNNPLNGIIRHLTEICGGNVHKEGVVNVTSSSYSSSYFDRLPIYAVDFDDNEHYFCSSNVKESWFQYDFINKRVCPTHYTIKTTNIYGKKSNNLKSWDILGSNTGLDNDWVTLHSKKEVDDLDDKNVVKTYDIQESSNQIKYFRYLRIKSTGPDSYGNNFMLFSALEFFGTLIYH